MGILWYKANHSHANSFPVNSHAVIMSINIKYILPYELYLMQCLSLYIHSWLRKTVKGNGVKLLYVYYVGYVCIWLQSLRVPLRGLFLCRWNYLLDLLVSLHTQIYTIHSIIIYIQIRLLRVSCLMLKVFVAQCRPEIALRDTFVFL